MVTCALCATPAVANHMSCGDTITQDTTLDGDLECDQGLTIGADDVTLDLGGYTIKGPGPGGGGYGVYAENRSGIVIRDGTIAAFIDGVRTDKADLALSGLELVDN